MVQALMIDREQVRRVGQRLRWLRAGFGALATNRRRLAPVPNTLHVSSPAFGDGRFMPLRYTQDGDSLSPPLEWGNLPVGTRSLALLVEDPDFPFPVPLVHALAYAIPPDLGGVAEGALPYRLRGRAPEGFAMGRNGLSRTGWIAPTPPPGHGRHHYAFEVFALDATPTFEWPPGRGYLLRRIRPHMLARGTLFGVYERD
jgi:Raf kinase inhibitor-like YbhB/YbcL family protein